MVLVTDPRGITMILVGMTMTCTGIAVMVKMAKSRSDGLDSHMPIASRPII